MIEIRDVLTTQQAAKLLGLSTTSVQKMVINGELAAWITPGGHRRIFRSGVDQLLKSRNAGLAGVLGVRALRILLVEDDPLQIGFFKSLLARSGHDAQLTIVNDATQAIGQVHALRPDLVVTELKLQQKDTFALIDDMATTPALCDLDVIALTSMSAQELAQAARLPRRVVRYQKPLTADLLCGYLDALTVRILGEEAAMEPYLL